jgi:hypothetical protein
VILRLPSRDNWNAIDLDWELKVNDILFTDVNDFVKWYGGRTARTQAYSAKFASGSVATAADLKVITDALKDESDPEDPDALEFNNEGKFISLDFEVLTGSAQATIFLGATTTDAFKGCKNLTGLNLKATGAMAIDASTFLGCVNLADLKLPTALSSTTLPVKAFQNLSALRTVDLGNVTTVDSNAFKTYAAPADTVTSGSIPITELTCMGIAASGYVLSPAAPSAFDSMPSLVTLNVAAATAGISTFAFRGSGLKTVNLPANFAALNIADSAFLNCKSLTAVNFPSGTGATWTGNIEANAFTGCDALRTVNIPVITGTIATSAFGGAESYVTNLTLGGPTTGTDAFKGNRRLDNVTLLINVTSIAANSFQDCINLKTVTFPLTGFLDILPSAFEGCERLSSDTTTLPTSLVSIGASAFKGCTNIKSVKLPTALKNEPSSGSPVEIVAANAFEKSGLTEVTIPGNAIKGIGVSAFKDCKELTKVVLPASGGAFLFIGANAFDGCSKLNTVTDEAKVTAGTVDDGLVLMPSSVFGAAYNATTPTGIGPEAFNACTSITSLKLDMVAASLAPDLGAIFKGCSKLETLTAVSPALLTGTLKVLSTATIPSVKYLILDVPGWTTTNVDFRGLSGLEELTVRATIPTAGIETTVFDAALNPKFTTLILTKANQGATAAGDVAFRNLPNTVKSVYIGDEEPTPPALPSTGINLGFATSGAGIFPPGVNYIEFTSVIGTLEASTLFTGLGGASAATKITVSINAPPAAKFAGSNAIGTVILGKDVTIIDATEFDSAFLKEFRVDEDSKVMGNWNRDGVLYGRDNTPGSGTFGSLTSLIQYPILKAGDSYGHGTSVPGSLNAINAGAFNGNALLKYLTIPSSITSIGAVNFTTGLPAVDTVAYNAIQATVTGATGFRPAMADVITAGVVTRNCVTIGDGVRRVPTLFATIGAGLTEITIPSSVVAIDTGAFVVGMSGLKVVNFNAVNLTTPNAFNGVTAIETIRIAPSVTAIPTGTFASTGVRVIRLPGIITIGENAFNLCNSLSSVTIGNRCETIGEGAFVQDDTNEPDYVLTTVEIESNGIISLAGAFNPKGGSGDELVNLYNQNKAGVYSWNPIATNFGWKYVKF